MLGSTAVNSWHIPSKFDSNTMKSQVGEREMGAFKNRHSMFSLTKQGGESWRHHPEQVIYMVISPHFSVCLMVSKLLFSQVQWGLNSIWKMLFNLKCPAGLSKYLLCSLVGVTPGQVSACLV